MSTDPMSRDQEIGASIMAKLGLPHEAVTYDEEGNLIALRLSPWRLGNLENLEAQDSGKMLAYGSIQPMLLPSEIWQLTNLQELYLNNNRLAQLPSEVGQLTNLQKLVLSNNQLAQLPSEIWQLTNLQELYLSNNQLSQLPSGIWQLTNLQELVLWSNQLAQLPSEVGQLTNLQELDLSDNELSQLPSEIWQLPNLRELDLSDNELSQLSSEIWQLTNLQRLVLWSNQLAQLPSEIGQLTNLQELDLSSNQLAQLPSEIGQLTNLQVLDLRDNQLSQLPPEIGQLTNLQRLYLSYNQLRQLPPEIGQLSKLEVIALEDNPHLLSPPPEIVARGTTDILAFLRELQEDSFVRYEAKLLIVGEGGTGKSSLLRVLKEEGFESNLSTTHGIEVGQLTLPHPYRSGTELTLNTWDFGGQQIYHATHQFFLTQRSVYLVAWNARLGAEQGRLNYWLDTIKALAPNEPVLLVATHIDERAPDLNYQLYQDAYPQVAGSLSVSNMNGEGLAELKDKLADVAAQLPVMGQPWPKKWLEAEKILLARPEHHFDAATYSACCSAVEVDPEISRGTLGNYLHDLGKILYFRDDAVLSNLVVLKPNWVTKAISYVLEDEATRKAKGILRHADLPRIWATDEEGRPYPQHLYPVFLRLMEKFDLSYQVEVDMPGDPATHSLIPQLLPHEPPADLPAWPETPPDGQREIEMIYKLDFVPAGIMSWFIVRTHRYTQNLHWREGVILEYEGHRARVELNPMLRSIKLETQGPVPYNFFTILKNTIDFILARFAGLRIERNVPCICYREQGAATPCGRFYLYEDLARRMEAGRLNTECPETFAEVSVPQMLYGIHMSTNEQVIRDIKHGQEEIARAQEKMFTRVEDVHSMLEEVNQRSELIWRDSTRRWNLEMEKLEAECPNTFFLLPEDGSRFNPRNWVSQEYRLYLMCQHPPDPHSVGDGYSVRQAEQWWVEVSPWLHHLIKFLKYGVPMGKAIGAVYDEDAIDKMKANIGLLEEITKALPQHTIEDSIKRGAVTLDTISDQKVVGPALRATCSFLNEVDPSKQWGGLHKTVTPDGNILWLCREHRQQYEPKPLVLG